MIEDGDVTLADSNAILVYLAARYDPSGAGSRAIPVAAARAAVASVAAGQLVAGPAAARAASVFGRKVDVEQAKGSPPSSSR